MGGLGAILIIVVVALVFRGMGSGPQKATLEVWGVFDDPKAFKEAISNFRIEYPNTKVNYKKFTYEEYEDKLVDAFASGTGPDVWMMHNTWLPRHKDKIYPLPQKISGKDKPLLTISEFKDRYVDVAYQDLVYNGEIYAVPIYIDTLALYYNKDLLNSAGIAMPPNTWEEMNSDVQKITIINEQGEITQSAVAMGTADNINRAPDIITLLMLQSGMPLTEDPDRGVKLSQRLGVNDLGEIVLEYYTDFSNPRKKNYTWNNQMDYSLDAFREGKTAMMINYSHHAETLRSQAPRFNFDVAPIPQLKDSNVDANYANYWAPTVSKSTKYPIQSWEFVTYLGSYAGSSSYVNASNRPPARRDLIDVLRNDDDLGIFAIQALSAKSWYQRDNRAIEVILIEMINDVNLGRRTIPKALQFAEDQINSLSFR